MRLVVPFNFFPLNSLNEKSQYQFLADRFDVYMQAKDTDRTTQTDTEHLLYWFDGQYDKFLSLAQVVADLGYKTAIDVPISEEEFSYRKQIRAFDIWMQHNKDQDKSHSQLLIHWLKTENNPRATYEQFMTLCRLVDTKGYRTLIDIPISQAEFEAEFGDFFLQKYREHSVRLQILYNAKMRQSSSVFFDSLSVNQQLNIEFIKRFHQMAHTKNPGISSHAQCIELESMLYTRRQEITDNYHFLSPNKSQLYTTLERILNLKNDHNGEVNAEYYYSSLGL